MNHTTFAYSIFALTVALSSSLPQAWARLDREPMDRVRPKQVEIVSYVGEIYCKDDKTEGVRASHQPCSLEFAREEDRKTFDLRESPELSSVVCSDHSRHLKVKIKAERMPRFLFWGGDLAVRQYEVLGESPTSACHGGAAPTSGVQGQKWKLGLRGKAV